MKFTLLVNLLPLITLIFAGKVRKRSALIREICGNPTLWAGTK